MVVIVSAECPICRETLCVEYHSGLEYWLLELALREAEKRVEDHYYAPEGIAARWSR